MKSKSNTVPNLFAEMFMSMLKNFLIILIVVVIINNIGWVYYMSKPATHRTGDTHVEITQTGNRDITQEINN